MSGIADATNKLNVDFKLGGAGFKVEDLTLSDVTKFGVGAMTMASGVVTSWVWLPMLGGAGVCTSVVGHAIDRHYTGLAREAMNRLDDGFAGLQPGTDKCHQLATAVMVDLTAKKTLLDRKPALLEVSPLECFNQRKSDLSSIQRKDAAILANLTELVDHHKNQIELSKTLHNNMVDNAEIIRSKFLGGLFRSE